MSVSNTIRLFVLFAHLIDRNVISLIIVKRKLIFEKNKVLGFTYLIRENLVEMYNFYLCFNVTFVFTFEMLTITSHGVQRVITTFSSQKSRQKDRQATNYHTGDR